MNWLDVCSPDFRQRVWVGLPVEVRARLERFGDDLLRYNRAQNLISRREPQAQLGALMEECIAAWYCVGRRLAGDTGAWADLGSGGGFPGLVFGALDPGRDICLIERRRGRCDFLEREASALGLGHVRVRCAEARSWEEEPFGVVLAKAVAPPGKLEALCERLVSTDGTLIVFGRPDDALGTGWHLAWEDALPGDASVLRGLRRS